MNSYEIIAILGSNFILVVGMLSVTVGIWLHQDKKIDEYRHETADILRGIQEEMKSFHGRLERQDAEFKSQMMEKIK